MKKILTLIVLTTAIIQIFAQGQRYILMEHFTNTTSTTCAIENNAFYTNIYPNNLENTHHITYYPPFPAPNGGNCVFHLSNILDNNGIVGLYPLVTTVPRMVLNGSVVPTVSGLVTQLQINNESFPPTTSLYFTDFELWENPAGSGEYTAYAIIKTEGDVPMTALTIRAAITEKGVDYNAPNGETFHRNVMRTMMPDYNGQTFNPAPNGNSTVYVWTPEIDTEWNLDSLCVLAWIIEDLSGEVINSGSSHDPKPLEVSVDNYLTQQSVSCFDDCDGSIFLDVEGGTPPYTYSWIPNVSSDEDISGLCAGNYSVTVTDFNGETSSASNINITNPAPLTAAVAVIPDQDSYCIGQACATISGGTLPVTSFWTDLNGDMIGNLNDNCILSACAGGYYQNAVDANGCEFELLVNVAGNIGDIECFINLLTDASCNGYNDGSIDIECTGFVGDLDFNWDGPDGFDSSAEDIVNLMGGTYTVLVSDDVGAQYNGTYTVVDPLPLNIDLSLTDDFDGNCNGSALANITGGNPIYFPVWNYDGPTPVNGLVLNDLCAGDYNLLVIDSKECRDSTDFTIEANSSILTTVPIDTSGVSCNGESNGTIEFEINGGTPPFDIGWIVFYPDNGGQSTPLPQYEDQLFANNLLEGFYVITITDADATETVFEYNVNEPEPLSLIVNPVDVCLDEYGNEVLGSATAYVTGGTPGYQYQWNNGNPTQTANNLNPGIYSVTVFDENLCQISDNNVFINNTMAGCIVGLDDQLNELTGINIVPTHFSDKLILKIDNDQIQNFTFDLVDLSGKIIKRESFENSMGTYIIQINEPLSSGVYFARVETEIGVSKHKLVH